MKIRFHNFGIYALAICAPVLIVGGVSQAGQATVTAPQVPATTATAPATTTTAQVSPNPAPPTSQTLICKKRVEIGSRLRGRRECLTAAQWEEIRVRSNDETRRLQRNPGDKRG